LVVTRATDDLREARTIPLAWNPALNDLILRTNPPAPVPPKPDDRPPEDAPEGEAGPPLTVHGRMRTPPEGPSRQADAPPPALPGAAVIGAAGGNFLRAARPTVRGKRRGKGKATTA
jgi:hypothetical protein